MRNLLFAITTMTAMAVEPCVKCHSQFQDRQVVRQKQAAMIQKIQSNQMPPGSTLTETEKKQLIQRIVRTANSK